MLRPLAIALLVGCGSPAAPRPPAPPPANVAAPVACEPELIDQVWTEQLDVALAGDRLVWHEYNFGRIASRELAGGPVRRLVSFDAEHHSESFAVAGRWVYWTSKATASIYRAPLAGGAPQTLATTGDDTYPTWIAVAGDVVYAVTDAGLVWWRGGEQGSLEHAGIRRIAASGDALYVADERRLHRLARPGAELEAIAELPGRVIALAATADRCWYVTESDGVDTVGRVDLESGDARDLATAADAGLPVIDPGGDAPLVAIGNVIHRLDGDHLEPIAVAPADVTGLASRGGSILAGTNQGSVHRLCPAEVVRPEEPTLECPAGLVLRAAGPYRTCDDPTRSRRGPRLELYASGHLKERTVVDGDTTTTERFYADGTPLSVQVVGAGGEQWRQFWANGKLAWRSVRAGDDESVERFNLDGTPRKD